MFAMQAVGYVKSDRTVIADDGWDAVRSRIEPGEELPAEARDGIEGFSHAEVVYVFDGGGGKRRYVCAASAGVAHSCCLRGRVNSTQLAPYEANPSYSPAMQISVVIAAFLCFAVAVAHSYLGERAINPVTSVIRSRPRTVSGTKAAPLAPHSK